MKTLFSLTFMLIISTSVMAQNQSDGLVDPIISFPIGPQFGGQEIFRFQPGIVTQLQTGSSFDFTSSQWFSIGNLDTALLPPPLTGTNEVFGLRFQLPSKSLILGYQDISDTNPRLQWIGQEEGIGDLEFRVADDFMSTNSDLVATMRSDTGTVFAQQNISDFDDAKVGVFNPNFDKSLEIWQEVQSSNRTYGVDVVNLSEAPENYGYNIEMGGSSDQNFGFNAIMNGNTSNSFGVRSEFTGQAGRAWGFNTNISGSVSFRWGVQARASGDGVSNIGVSGIAAGASNNIGIYGAVPVDANGDSLNPGDLAGFFEGDVTVTGIFTSSDKKLKKNINEINNALESLWQLQPKTYEFIKTNKKVLPRGQQYGFIAQELEEVFPELIKNVKKPVFDKEGNITEFFEYKSVNYIPLIAVLTASIQELSKEVEDLKATNNSYLVYSDRLTSEEQKRLESLAYKLEQNYPNPFSGKSVIEYSLPDNEKDASIMVFDLNGGLIKTFNLKEKSGQIIISSEDFKSGMYLYSLVVRNDEIMTKKMIVR